MNFFFFPINITGKLVPTPARNNALAAKASDAKWAIARRMLSPMRCPYLSLTFLKFSISKTRFFNRTIRNDFVKQSLKPLRWISFVSKSISAIFRSVIPSSISPASLIKKYCR